MQEKKNASLVRMLAVVLSAMLVLTGTALASGNSTWTGNSTSGGNSTMVYDLTATGIEDMTYTGSPLTQSNLVVEQDGYVVPADSYEITYANNTNAGKASFTISRHGSQKTFYFNIKRAPIAGASVSGVADKQLVPGGVTQTPTIKVGGRTLRANTDYALSYVRNTKVGTATMTITGKGNYTGSLTKNFKITQGNNPLTVKAKKATVKLAKLNNKNQTLKVSKVLKVSKAEGTIRYAKKSGNKKITINKRTGKVTVKKGLRKGTYKIKVKVTAAGNGNYKKGTKTVTVRIKVK